MKKALALLLVFGSLLAIGCTAGNAASDFNADKEISVVSREDGSGTRGAFIQLTGIEVSGEDGSKKDTTTKEAIIAKQTDVMMTNVAQDRYAIGYISLGSLNGTVKALAVDEVAPSSETVKEGAYPISRPFYIAHKGELTGLAKDFAVFMVSAQGQEVVSKNYIPVSDDAPEYTPAALSGKIVVAGSSSVTPVMEKLKEAYLVHNPDATIEIQQSDSSAGMTGAIDGTCDIGMASRDLKESELAVLTPTAIALDGIAVIVNPENPVSGLTTEQIRGVFTGEITQWKEIQE